MADLSGLFTNPQDYRSARINDLMQQQQRIQGMGGSMSDLLGQVAASGGLTGQMMAEGAAGMFGMKTAEEDKAAQIQDLASNFDLRTPEGMRGMARQLNNLGMTEEAIKLIDVANSTESSDLTLQLQRKKVEDYKTSPDWEYGVVGEKATPVGMQKVYGWYNKRTREIDTNLPAPDTATVPNNKPEIDFGGSNARPAGQ